MQNQNYRDFYGKSLIPACAVSTDLVNEMSGGTLPSHWLIALEGEPSPESSFFVWRVSIFAADSDGIFNANAACYTSTKYQSIDEALEIARQLEKEICSDDESVPPIEEKIS